MEVTMQATVQELVPLSLLPQLEPHNLLALLVGVMFLVLLVVGVWSRSRRRRLRGPDLGTQEWRDVLLQRFAEIDEKGTKSDLE